MDSSGALLCLLPDVPNLVHVDSSGALLCLLPDVPNLVHVDSNLFGVRWGGVDWGEREKDLTRGAPPTAPLPEKGSTTKKILA